MNNSSATIFNARQTAELLDFPRLVQTLETTVLDYASGAICAPERQAVPFPQGAVMLSMPATAADIGIHKLVNVAASNTRLNLPTINGLVAVYDGKTGQLLFVLDGPTVTARRTAAISMLGLKTFLKQAPTHVALIGTGTQASGHAQAIAALFPDTTVFLASRSIDKAHAFIQAHRHLKLKFEAGPITAIPSDIDVVITATTSQTPVYNEPARAGRLVLGLGAFKADMAEIAAQTVLGSRIYVDDPAGAHHEAGDLILAGVDWSQVTPLANALRDGVDFDQPLLFKSVGCAAWDLGAARCALAALKS